MVHGYPDAANEAARIVPVQGTRKDASAARPDGQACADSISVERQGGRIFVVITRRYPRYFGLSDAEARQLAGQLAAEAGAEA